MGDRERALQRALDKAPPLTQIQVAQIRAIFATSVTDVSTSEGNSNE